MMPASWDAGIFFGQIGSIAGESRRGNRAESGRVLKCLWRNNGKYDTFLLILYYLNKITNHN